MLFYLLNSVEKRIKIKVAKTFLYIIIYISKLKFKIIILSQQKKLNRFKKSIEKVTRNTLRNELS